MRVEAGKLAVLDDMLLGKIRNLVALTFRDPAAVSSIALRSVVSHLAISLQSFGKQCTKRPIAALIQVVGIDGASRWFNWTGEEKTSVCHALIIEDEAVIAFHIADVVEEGGATSIAFAQSELEAVSAAMARRPGIIVSDVKLLTGTGPEAVTSIRYHVGRVPAIFITGNPEMLLGYDHDGVMDKPFNPARLRREVARLAMDC